MRDNMAGKKIAFLLPNMRGGGAERVSLLLADQFIENGLDVYFILLQESGELLSILNPKCKIISLNKARIRSVYFDLVKSLRTNNIDILISFMWPLTVIAPLVKFLIKDIKVIIGEQAVISEQYKGILQRLTLKVSSFCSYRIADVLIACSDGVRLDMANLSCMKKARVKLIYNPAKLSEINEIPTDVMNEVENSWRVPMGCRFISVGGLKYQKNHELLVRAFASASIDDSELKIVGSGELYDPLSELIDELRVADRVELVGFKLDPTPYYTSADVFVLTSRYEGFALVIVEALAAGLEVISVDCPSGPAEILQAGMFGAVIRNHDEELLAQKLVEFAKSPKLNRDRNIGRSQDFSPERIARQYINLFN
jgi:glycosyltransferase involved in cell wall biosynthesis